MRWIGLLSSERVQVRANNLLDTLCARLEALMKYEDNERDMVMLQHKFVVEWQDGKVVRCSSCSDVYVGFLTPASVGRMS